MRWCLMVRKHHYCCWFCFVCLFFCSSFVVSLLPCISTIFITEYSQSHFDSVFRFNWIFAYYNLWYIRHTHSHFTILICILVIRLVGRLASILFWLFGVYIFVCLSVCVVPHQAMTITIFCLSLFKMKLYMLQTHTTPVRSIITENRNEYKTKLKKK